jgi:dynein heavy chain, axonemal
LIVGPTGTGKSVYIQNVLLNVLPREKYLTIEIGFSAQTHCNQVQDIVDGKLDKIRTGIFGPRLGMKCVIFVDDLNMPTKEFYGAQPPIEILRQFMAQGGWYDYKDKKHPFRNMQDTIIINAMGPPGGGKAYITNRYQRHFNVIAVASFDDNAMKTIFSSILKWYFRTGAFATDVANMETKVVAATLQIYKQIGEILKPTPLKSHYTFNLRDVSKVICGVCLASKKEVPNSDVLTRLWAHEITRVFGDRLINDEDRTWMMNAVKDAVRAPFGGNFDTMFKHLDNDFDGKVETLDEYRALAFGDIYTPFGMTERPYEEIADSKRMFQCADDALTNYNNMSDKPMDLVLFAFAIEHLLRIGRVLKQPGGHAMLVGVGGSGRQSLTRLASKLGDFDIFQIEIKKVYRMIEFREDIKTLLRGCGGKGQMTTFIFTDNSIKEESFLEDINNILNTGEVPNIFPPDEKAEV